jgi:multicomponent Na+:H+ antiporter subunit A
MPFTFIGALVAGLSMGGFPPLFGFVAKEVWLQSLGSAVGLTVATVVGGAAYVVVGLSVGWKPFVGSSPEGQRAHEAPWLMRLGPIILGVGSILMAIFCGIMGTKFVQPAAMAIYGKPFSVDLHLWEGFNRYLYISLATLALGVFAFRIRPLFLKGAKTLSVLSPLGAEAGYQRGLEGILSLATWLTKRLQTGLLRDYIRVVILFAVALVGVAFWRSGMVFTGAVTAWQPQVVLLAGIMGAAALSAIVAKSRLGSILCLGVVGYGVAMLFSFYSAPDLAMTQLVIESLTIILIALAFYHLPHKQRISPRATRWTDGLIATLFGGVMVVLVMAAIHVEHVTPVSDYFLKNSYLEAHGRNVVNVILVDFRALDTLGEITVLTVAALGGFALLKLRSKKKKESS